jgi:DNA-directed RNA polymerase specialized sigma24 family protein
VDQNQNFRTHQARSNIDLGTEKRTVRELPQGSANDPLYRAAVTAAKTRAYRAAISAGLTPAEREDLCQEILLDIYERKGQFDPMRGAPGTFTGLVSAHCTAEFLKARNTDRKKLIFSEPEDVDTLEVIAIDRVIHGIVPTRNAANDDDGGSSDSLLVEDVSTCWALDIELFSNSDAQHDLVAALEYMSSEQRSLFDLLATYQDLPLAAKASEMSSATFYRRVADLQMHLRMFGIRSIS